MRIRLLITALTVMALVLCVHAQAVTTVLLQDDFNSENGGKACLNYNSFAHWDVTAGTVDLIGNGSFDFYPGNGLYVDLDGSTNNAGVLTSKDAFEFDSVATYVMAFDLGGAYTRTETNTVRVSLGLNPTGGGSTISLWSQDITLAANAGLLHYEIPRTVGSSTTGSIALSFENIYPAGKTGDNVGLILDNVSWTEITEFGAPPSSTPELGTWLLLACTGLFGLIPGLRRRRL